jgi:hypothetical protein
MSAVDVGKSPAWKVTRALLILAGLWLVWENLKAGQMVWLIDFLEWAWGWVLRAYEWITTR